MNARSSATIPALAAISCLGIALAQATPAFAGTCRSTQTFGSIDFGDCQSTNIVGGGSISIDQYRVRQAAQFDVAIADYNNTATANIAQLPIRRTMTAWKLKNGELKLFSLALESPGDFTYANSRVAVLAGNKEYLKDF
jgi:hypothetical protein